VISCATASSSAAVETEHYRATFTATWTSTSHPVDFPDNAHWSPLIGGVHNDQVVFWQPGGVASEGIQNMAELGATSSLAEEVGAAISAGSAWEVVRGGSIPTGAGSASVEFGVNETYPLITLTSMVAPSPDWFVGVHGLSLRENNQWIGKIVMEMFAYDAGTDSGVSFKSANEVTIPRGTIEIINRPPLENPLPFGTFTFLRLIPYDFNESGVQDAADIDLLSAAVRDGSNDLKYDVNGDQIVGEADRQAWISQLRGTCTGDANLDGLFTSDDLVMVLTAGQYEDAEIGNSSWATGDWSGDAEFDSSDLIVAFQEGCYETGGVAAASVPEPAGTKLALVSLHILAVLARPMSVAGRGRT
jgi:hypothetical protein